MTVEYRDDTPFTGDNHTPTELANAIRTKKNGKYVREPIAQAVEKLSNAVLGGDIGNVVATPTKVFANLTELQKAYPYGSDGVMVTVDDGHKYFWQDNSWVDGGVYQAAETGKVLTADRILNSKIDYSALSSWNGCKFEVKDSGVVEVADGNRDRGVIFRVEKPTKYFNFKVIASSLESGATIDFWKYDSQASNGVGQLIKMLTLEESVKQKVVLQSIGSYMVAIHGKGPVKVKFSVSDSENLDVSDLSKTVSEISTATLIDKDELGIEFPLQKVGLFGNVTKIESGDGIVANVLGNNGGFFTQPFTATSERVKVVLDGVYTQQAITIQIRYTSSLDGKTYFFRLADFQGGILQTFEFDASSLIIYQHADKSSFRILIQANIDSLASKDNDPVGKIVLKSIYIKDGASQSNLYDYKLKSTLLNLANKLESLEGDINTIKADNSAYVTMPDGTKGRIIYANGQLTVKNNIYKKILFLGNSLLLGLSTNGSHGAPFGLTASNPQKDWAYLLTQKLQAKYSSSVTVNKLHDAVFEQSESDETSQNYINNNLAQAEKNNDLVIVQIGDNVNSDLRRATFKANFEKLINAIKSTNPTADILIAGVWFDGAGLQNWLLDFANSHGCMFAPLHDLYNGETIAKVGDTITFADDVQMKVYEAIKTHPGDKGHALIADRIYSTLYPK